MAGDRERRNREMQGKSRNREIQRKTRNIERRHTLDDRGKPARGETERDRDSEREMNILPKTHKHAHQGSCVWSQPHEGRISNSDVKQ